MEQKKGKEDREKLIERGRRRRRRRRRRRIPHTIDDSFIPFGVDPHA
jgi:hypothetical protein